MEREERPAEQPKAKRRIKQPVMIALIAAALLVIVILFAVVMPTQSAELRRLEAERKAKEQELHNPLLQQETLQELSALIGNRDYLIRYLRETQGYMFPGDIRIDLDDPFAEVPTPGPRPNETPLPTIAPTADPFATEAPESELPETSPSPEG